MYLYVKTTNYMPFLHPLLYKIYMQHILRFYLTHRKYILSMVSLQFVIIKGEFLQQNCEVIAKIYISMLWLRP